MDLGAPDAFLGFNCIVFVCISTVPAISCKQNIINVNQSNSFEVNTASICVSNSGGEWGGSPPGPPGHPWAFPMVFVVVVVVVVVHPHKDECVNMAVKIISCPTINACSLKNDCANMNTSAVSCATFSNNVLNDGSW